MNTKIEIGKIKLSENRFLFPVIVAIIFIPILFIIVFDPVLSRKNDSSVGNYGLGLKNDVKISTSKNKYSANEGIILHVDNKGRSSVYFEPCETLNAFEKKVGTNWVLQDRQETNPDYSSVSAFEKKDGNAECKIGFPPSGPGTYRVVVPIFYGCTQPSRYACQSSQNFYSNEFEVVDSNAK
jgi:hypothetical protein